MYKISCVECKNRFEHFTPCKMCEISSGKHVVSAIKNLEHFNIYMMHGLIYLP